MSDDPAQNLASMVEAMARGLVDHPDQVRVEAEPGDTAALSLYVAQEDLGQVIGRGGRIARALRTVVREAAHQRGVKATLDIVD